MAEMSFPNLIDDIILTMKRWGLKDILSQALPNKRKDNHHVPFDILLCLFTATKFKCKTNLYGRPLCGDGSEVSGRASLELLG